MRLISISTAAAKKLFWSGITVMALLFILTAGQQSPLLLVGSAVLVLLGFVPLYYWLTGVSHGLPIWPVFSAYTSTIAAMPVVQAARSLELYSDAAIFTGLTATAAFLAVGTIVWLSMTSIAPKPPESCLMLEPGTAVRSLFWCVAAGIAFQVNAAAGWIDYPGNSMPVVRGVTGGLSYLGVFALSFFQGSGLLGRAQSLLFAAMLVLLCLLSITGLMLAGAVPIAALALMGYVLGARRLPLLAILLLFPILTVLHAGKYQMREIYYSADGVAKAREGGLIGLVPFFAEWTSYGLEEIGGLAGIAYVSPKGESSQSSIFERAGNLHMLLLVMSKTPGEVPYLNGATYAPIPQMLIPRFLSPNKAISHAGNIMLSMNYGLVDQESSRSVSIGWSLLAEAYANFGYGGVIVLSALLAALYSEVARLTSGVPITSFRFISGLIVLSGVTNENSLGVFITMQFQGIVGVLLASFFLMRRQQNPYAFQTEECAACSAQTPSGRRSRTAPSTRAPWMPRGMRRRLAAQRESERNLAETERADGETDGKAAVKPTRPRQVAAPIQPYYYRSRKA